MPLRSVKMNRFIFGFQRRVWCPKWTPLSSSWRVVTTAMAVPFFAEGASAAPARCGLSGSSFSTRLMQSPDSHP